MVGFFAELSLEVGCHHEPTASLAPSPPRPPDASSLSRGSDRPVLAGRAVLSPHCNVAGTPQSRRISATVTTLLPSSHVPREQPRRRPVPQPVTPTSSPPENVSVTSRTRAVVAATPLATDADPSTQQGALRASSCTLGGKTTTCAPRAWEETPSQRQRRGGAVMAAP